MHFKLRVAYNAAWFYLRLGEHLLHNAVQSILV